MLQNIIVNIDEKSIKIINSDSDFMKVEFVDKNIGSCIYQDIVAKGMFVKSYIKDLNNCRIYIRKNDKYSIDFFIYDITITNKDYTIVEVNPLDFFDFNNEIVYITGSSGGGTSIITKFLKFLGAHAGEDSGNLEIRKPHEPYGFRLWVQSLDSKFPQNYHKNNFLKIINTYNYKKDSVNIIKIPNSENQLSILSEIFPNLKLLTVVKEQNNFFSTKEGERFNKLDKLELFKKQFPIIEGLRVFHVNFDKFFTDFHYVNKILKFIKLDCIIQNENQFNFIKESINFDQRVLEKNK